MTYVEGSAYSLRIGVLWFKKNKIKNMRWLGQEAWAVIHQRKAIKEKLVGARSERQKQRWQDEYRKKDREVKSQVRMDRRQQTDDIANEAENAAGQHHIKTLYSPTKVLSNDRPRQSAAVKDKSGNILNAKESKTKR